MVVLIYLFIRKMRPSLGSKYTILCVFKFKKLLTFAIRKQQTHPIMSSLKRFLDLGNDIAFKKIFGTEENTDVVIAVLNAILKK